MPYIVVTKVLLIDPWYICLDAQDCIVCRLPGLFASDPHTLVLCIPWLLDWPSGWYWDLDLYIYYWVCLWNFNGVFVGVNSHAGGYESANRLFTYIIIIILFFVEGWEKNFRPCYIDNEYLCNGN
jgi:hypothetical protein